MVSIQQFSVFNSVPNRKFSSVSKKHENVVPISLQANSPTLLEDYLALTGKQNLALVSFGQIRKSPTIKEFYPSLERSSVTLPDTNIRVDAFKPTMSDYAKWKIRTEATKRIYGSEKWNELEDIEAWMVSVESDKFMVVGGLGKVTADLPGSFNRKFAGDKKNNMGVVTPLYTYKDEYKLVRKDGKYYYYYGTKLNPVTKRQEPNKIELNYKGQINVPIYNPTTNTKMEDVDVKIFSAYVDYTINPKTGKPNQDGTPYLFFCTPDNRIGDDGRMIKNAQIFDIEENNHESENNKTPYAFNKYGTDELTRNVFLSKAVYTALKNIKQGKLEGIKAPNTIIINDWHPGPLAALIRYGSTAEADSGKISSEVGEYMDSLNIIDILHNCEHQGLTYGDTEKRTSVFATLFGEYGIDILANAKSWRSDSPEFNPKDEDKISLMKGESFSCGATGLMLADRVVPVSGHYTNELLHSERKAKGMMDLFKARYFSPHKRTLTPITNGYTKSLIAPNEKHMESVLNQLRKDLTNKNVPKIKLDDISFKPFEDGNIENKLHNKNEFMKLLKRIHERELKLVGNTNSEVNERRYFMYDPQNTVIPNMKDYKDMPLMVFAGRFDPQKGVGTILKDAMWEFAKKNVDTPEEKLPLFVIGGKITQNISYERFRAFKDELRTAEGGKYKHIADRIVFFKGYVNTNLLASAADLFFVPSVFEPCGLTQMEAMAKGALPIATSTGGLVNTIEDNVDGFRTKAFFEQEGTETLGRLYGTEYNNNGEAYYEAMQRAVDLFHNDRPKFEQMQKKAIERDFSWDKEGGPLDKFIELIKTGKVTAA